MAASGTPPFRGYLKTAARSGPSATPLHDNESSSDDEAAPTRSANPSLNPGQSHDPSVTELFWVLHSPCPQKGLNPLMFIFALVANLTYVLSIVVRTTEWDSIKPNMPWLLDAGVCVVLDFFIIMQYMYYKYMHKRMMSQGEDYREYMDAKIKSAAFA